MKKFLVRALKRVEALLLLASNFMTEFYILINLFYFLQIMTKRLTQEFI